MELNNAEDAGQILPPRQDLPQLRPALRLAKEVGEVLGRSQILFGALSACEVIVALASTV